MDLRSRTLVTATGLLLALGLAGCAREAARIPDFAGTWLPHEGRAAPWPDDLPLTPEARATMASFDPSQHDPVTFCMPLGTPRNVLQTEYPLEIIQLPDRLIMVVQPDLANAEVRRIRLDASDFPDNLDATWFGTSRGHWEGDTLVIETRGLRPDAPVNGQGLTHSAALRMIERLRLVNDAELGEVLVDDIELHDPQAYTAPVKAQRTFVRSPQARPREGTCVERLWIDKLWRDRLGEHAEAARTAGRSR